MQTRLCTYTYVLYSVQHLIMRVMCMLLLCIVKLQGDVLGCELALQRRMQLQELPGIWLLRMPCCEVATVWIKFQKCLKEMPSPSATPIVRMMSLSPPSPPICHHEQSTNSQKWCVFTVATYKNTVLIKVLADTCEDGDITEEKLDEMRNRKALNSFNILPDP